MRAGAWRRRHTQLRRAVAEGKLALRRAQQNHGARQQKLLGCRFHGALERDPVERLERCWRRPHDADGARHDNHDCRYFGCHYLPPWSCRGVSGLERLAFTLRDQAALEELVGNRRSDSA